MPTYPYFCAACGESFDVVKSVASYANDESCKTCGALASRQIGRVNFSTGGDWRGDYNPAFGCVVKSKQHQKELLSRIKGETGRELVEVGTEPVENIHKICDKSREENHRKIWDEPSEQILAEVLR